MAYQGVRDFATGLTNIRIELNTGTELAPVWEDICGLINADFTPNLKTDEFETICDAGFTTTVPLGLNMEVGGTFKYDTENEIIPTLYSKLFDITQEQSLNLRITIVPIRKVFEGKWILIPETMSFDTEAVIEVPVMFKTYGKQTITEYVPPVTP